MQQPMQLVWPEGLLAECRLYGCGGWKTRIIRDVLS